MCRQRSLAQQYDNRLRLLPAMAATVVMAAHSAVDPGPAAPPRTEFVPPAAGTYVLQHIQRAADGVLLDRFGRLRHLSTFTHGKITLLTFFYTYCADPVGCPLAYTVLSNLRERLSAQQDLRSAVRFVSVSLDPTNDTPAAISQYGALVAADPHFEWRFLTARSVSDLLPLLDDFGQDVSIETDGYGRPTRTLHHLLKVFLIDRQGVVREIYSLAFLQPEVIFNDIRTLAMEPRVR